MTAEMGVINKQGLVLAADSAVTINGQKVHNTSNKLFTLGPNHYVGMMIFGNAEFMGVPWSILISKFNKNIGEKRLKSISDYKDKFIEFIRDSSELQSEIAVDSFVSTYAYSLLRGIISEFNRDLQANKLSGGNLLNDFFSSVILERVLRDEKWFEQHLVTKNYEFDEFNTAHSETIKRLVQTVDKNNNLFPGLIDELLSDRVFPTFKKLIYNYITSGRSVGSDSGVVIAGYGSEQTYPELISVAMFGNIDGHLSYRDTSQDAIGSFATKDTATAAIVPFAQSDVVSTIMNGIAPQLSNELFKILDIEGVDQTTRDNILDRMSDYQQNNFISPMIDSIGTLTISELAEVAETFVNVTSFKRKYTSDLATVGGPIDILSISYNEGPIWIKQKHYFDIKDNADYTLRREKNV